MIVTQDNIDTINKELITRKYFAIQAVGGAGNYIGSIIGGLVYYKMFGLDKSHKLFINSFPHYNGYFNAEDIFEDNENIFFCNSERGLPKFDFDVKLNCIKEFPFEKNDLDYNSKNIYYNNNHIPFIPKEKEDLCKEYMNELNFTLREDIKIRIHNFLTQNNISPNEKCLGAHFRCTDASNSRKGMSKSLDEDIKIIKKKIKIKNIKKVFICSDDNTVEKKLKLQLEKQCKCVIFNKDTRVKKIPGLEKYDWYIYKKKDINEIKKKMPSLNSLKITIKKAIKSSSLSEKEIYKAGWGKNKNDNYYYMFNTFRDKEQVVDAIIDTIIFNHCSNHYINCTDKSSLLYLGEMLIKLGIYKV